jgi:hypothetical protein
MSVTLDDKHKRSRFHPESSSARTCTQYQILYNHCLSPSSGSLSFPQAPFSYSLLKSTFLSSRCSSQPITTMSVRPCNQKPSRRRRQQDQGSQGLGHLYLRSPFPLPRLMASILIPKAQVQTIDGPQSIHDDYTKFDVSSRAKMTSSTPALSSTTRKQLKLTYRD